MQDKLKNFKLIGLDNSRYLITTPSLIIDFDKLEQNINKMASKVKNSGISIRPHSKTHKMPKISNLQIEAGALGICVATSHEAEIMARNGISNILLTTPVTNKENLRRLIPIINNGSLTLVIDDINLLETIQEIFYNCKNKVKILIDIDIMSIGKSGISRTGARSIQQILSIIEAVNKSEIIEYKGIAAYAGDLQHINSYTERKTSAYERYSYLSNILHNLSSKNLKPKIVSGGGTGTHILDINSELFTELQPGSYIFNDYLRDGSRKFNTRINIFSNQLNSQTVNPFF